MRVLFPCMEGSEETGKRRKRRKEDWFVSIAILKGKISPKEVILGFRCWENSR